LASYKSGYLAKFEIIFKSPLKIKRETPDDKTAGNFLAGIYLAVSVIWLN